MVEQSHRGSRWGRVNDESGLPELSCSSRRIGHLREGLALQTEPKAEPPIPLSRERVLRAAIALADEKGIQSLSMRKLGQQLGVEAMSLYKHVTNKDDMLDGMIDVVFTEIDLRSSGIHWKKAMRQRAFSARDTLSRHPWAIGLTDRG